LAGLCLLAAGWLGSAARATAAGSGASAGPDAVCAQCHKAIYDRYEATPMARASGTAAEGFLPADFTHEASGIHYKVTEDGGRVWLEYERPEATASRELAGRVELKYFIGSGLRGRTYLFDREGYWFEAPINWYGKKRVWDMAPNFLAAREMPLTLPVDPGCLHCHASEVAESLPDARNHYAGEPFGAVGITCASCHGDGGAHVASGGKARMMDLDALEPVRRDSICLNCHLEGQAAVIRAGKRLAEFKPGDDLFDYAVFFVRKNENGSGGRATSQWEALLKSRCKQVSGDRMTCTTCHDPHGAPGPEERVAFYRAKCLQCHSANQFAERHHPENPDCAECHMARIPSNDIAHEQVTDHWIRKRVSSVRLLRTTSGPLVTVGGVTADDRDTGLAYAQMATLGDETAGRQALALLIRAEKEQNGAAGDAELHAELGFLEQMDGNAAGATAEYKLALEADQYESLAAGDLAVLDAEAHDYGDAVGLWRRVFEDDPAQLAAGMDLAMVECAAGEIEQAKATVARLQEFAPDDGKVRALAARLRDGGGSCSGK
jgi:predicted CXXCH cytochrome family protein